MFVLEFCHLTGAGRLLMQPLSAGCDMLHHLGRASHTVGERLLAVIVPEIPRTPLVVAVNSIDFSLTRSKHCCDLAGCWRADCRYGRF